MKLFRYGEIGAEKPGIIDADGGLRDLSSQVSDIDGVILSPENLKKLAAIDPASLPLVPAGTRIGPCVGSISKIVAIGLNYSDHAEEAGMPVPTEPIIFMKATSAICGPDDDVIKPVGSTQLDYEVELGIVIGVKANYVSEEAALDYVAGYCIVNDVSERSYQVGRPGGQWDKGKGCDTFAPVGPWMVTTDEIPDPQILDLELDVNGEKRQRGSTAKMVFNVRQLVSDVSNYMTLLPGDIIITGTPPGVGMGMKPPVYLEPGDEMRLAISGLGEQHQNVIAYR
ncbi:MAG: fumarylacetoacetate hydrolase family protein [Rhizobiales bacterium]|nr:fumarylacetoacetate hydrolase family protein [Hyphomicrobiales bacterium]